jgi:hypothetical protein
METINKDTNRLIMRLREQKPVLQNADLLTDSIMDTISSHKQNRLPNWLLWTRIVSSAAAAIFICLLVYQKTDVNAATQSSICMVHKPLTIESLLKNKPTNEQKSYLIYLQQNIRKNKRLQNIQSFLTSSDNEIIL